MCAKSVLLRPVFSDSQSTNSEPKTYNVSTDHCSCSRGDFEEVREQLAAVLCSMGAHQQSMAMARGEVAHDSYYKVGRGAGICGRCDVLLMGGGSVGRGTTG